MKTVVIGDTHFHNSNKGLRHEQLKTIKRLYQLDVDNVIFLGDVFDKRNPSPECVLDVKRFFDGVFKDTYILRGNHDSATKSDNGVTMLSVLERTGETNITIVTQTMLVGSYYMIPHYEDDLVVKKYLYKAPKDCMVFGHFGFDGALNNAGDADCSLELDDFSNPTILGHIHSYCRERDITVLGTPYTTCFQDIGQKYYGLVEQNVLTVHESNHGPKHLVLEPEDLSSLSVYEDCSYLSIRLMLDSTTMEENYLWDLKRKYPQVAYWDLKFKVSYDEEELSYYDTSSLSDIDDDVIAEYLKQSKTSWNNEELLEILSELKNAD